MDAYTIRLESIFTLGRVPAYHLARYADDAVFDPVTQSFAPLATYPAADNPIVQLQPATGLLAGMYMATIPILPCFIDGYYVIYYHDMLQNGEIYTWEAFQVTDGQCDYFTDTKVSDLISEIFTQIAAQQLNIEAVAG